MATKHRVEINNPSGPELSIHLIGPSFANVDSALLEHCFSDLLTCAEDNACFERGFSAACLGVIAQHSAETHCVEQAFGFVGAH